MSLIFTNQTDYEALCFDQGDPHCEPYRVVVTRIGHTLAPASVGGDSLQEGGDPVASDRFSGKQSH